MINITIVIPLDEPHVKKMNKTNKKNINWTRFEKWIWETGLSSIISDCIKNSNVEWSLSHSPRISADDTPICFMRYHILWLYVHLYKETAQWWNTWMRLE